MSIFVTTILFGEMFNLVVRSTNILAAELNAALCLFAIFMIVLAIFVYIWVKISQRVKTRKLFRRLKEINNKKYSPVHDEKVCSTV